MSFLFGFSLPVERLPLLVVGPTVIAIGVVIGFVELNSPGTVSLWSCAADVLIGLALTIYGVVKRRDRLGKRDAVDAGEANRTATHRVDNDRD